MTGARRGFAVECGGHRLARVGIAPGGRHGRNPVTRSRRSDPARHRLDRRRDGDPASSALIAGTWQIGDEPPITIDDAGLPRLADGVTHPLELE